MIEYILYGLPRQSTERYDEVLLLSDAKDPKRVEKVKQLAARDGFHSFRIAAVDLSKPPKFGANLLGDGGQ